MQLLLCAAGDAVHLPLCTFLQHAALLVVSIVTMRRIERVATRVVMGLARHGRSSGAAHRAQNDVLPVGSVLLLVLVEMVIAAVAARWRKGSG